MTEAEIYAALTDIFSDVLVKDDIVLRPETTADNIEGWDSFTNINLMVATEAHFGIKLSTQDIEGLKNIGALARLIQVKLN